MEKQIFDFRVLLIQLSNELSDHSREELHFVVDSIVPRKLRDDCTPTGTLHLFQCLFDRTLITDQQCDYLIHVFREIDCCEAVEKLEGSYCSLMSWTFACYLSCIEFRRCQKPRTSSMRSTDSIALNESVSNTEVDKIGNISSKNTLSFISYHYIPLAKISGTACFADNFSLA
jgi:hypothetical protein